MDISHLVEGLNQQQREAVCANEENCLVLAGAGSGKTRVLVHRIAWLIEVVGVSPHSILAITFTNKAANEMNARITELLKHSAGGIWCGTFHAISRRILNQQNKDAGLIPNFTIMDSADQKRFIRRVMEQLNLDRKKFPPDGVQKFINKQKEQGLRAADIERGGDYMHNQLLQIYTAYEKLAAQEHLVDFAELLLRTYELLSRNKAIGAFYAKKFRHILVDEFQDTNGLQFSLIKALQGSNQGSPNDGGDGKGHNKGASKTTSYVMAVGDEDQSIYGWRGAEIGNILNFEKMFAGSSVYRLEKNYRSTENIINAANAVISNNRERLGKKLWSDIKNDKLVDFYRAPTDKLEAAFVADAITEHYRQGNKLQDCAVFYRANAQSRIIEETLVHSKIPYRVYGGLRFYDRAEIKNVIGYMRLLVNRNDTEAMRRIINIPSRGIGGTSLGKLNDYALDSNLSLWDASIRIVDGGDKEKSILNSRAINAIKQFLDLIEKTDEAINGLTLQEQTATIIKLSGLEGMYEHGKDAGNESARENLKEFINAANVNYGSDEGSDMAIFLSNVALESGGVQANEYEDAVQLMTIHSSKGLEFPMVFMTGMEEGLFPLEKASFDESALEEERRLCYVGMTRACRHLCMSCCESRLLYGHEAYNPVSRFVEEVPKHLVRELSRNQRHQPYLNQDDSSHIPTKIGQQVSHPTFGYGKITNLEGLGASARVEVDFEDEGPKWLVLQYAELQLL